MAESLETISEGYTHFQRDVIIADTEESNNYAALHKSDRDVADLSATRAEHVADANLPETTVDRYGYLQLVNEREVKTISTLHTTCTKPDGLDDTQQSLADYTISPYDTTVIKSSACTGEVSGSNLIDNTLITKYVSANALYNDILNSAVVNENDNIASNVYGIDDGNVANSVLYNDKSNNNYDDINNLNVNVYNEIATAEDGVGVYNEISTDNTEYAEVDTRSDSVYGGGADIHDELRDTYAAMDTFSRRRSSRLSRLSSLSIKRGITAGLIIVVVLIAAALVYVTAKKGIDQEGMTNMNIITNQKQLISLKLNNVTVRNLFQGPDSCIYLISINIANGRLMIAYTSSVLHILSLNDSKATVDKNLTMPAPVIDAVWTTDGHIVCTTVEKTVLRLTQEGNVVATNTMPEPHTLYADADGVIYLTDRSTGIHLSTDDGRTWNYLMNKTTDGDRGLVQAIKVFSDSNQYTYDFWTVEQTYCEAERDACYRLRVYTVNKDSHVVKSWRNITHLDNISPYFPPRLAYDGNNNVFLAEYRSGAIHLLSTREGRYDRLLMNLIQFGLNGPDGLSVDTEQNVLYVGLCEKIASFTLNYED